MPSEPLMQRIRAELRELRKQPGLLDAAKLTSAPALLKGLGGDNADVALVRLVDLAAEHGQDRDIEAAIASMGYGVVSESALDRLSEFSETHFVDPRTVRRWSDEGIRKLTLLILGSAPWIQPRARLVLVAAGEMLQLGVDLRIPPGLAMRTPTFFVGQEQIEIRMPDIVQSSDPQRLRTGLEDAAPLVDLPLRLRMSWTGEKLPIYESVTRGTPDIYFNSRLVFRSLMATVSRWRG